jgi:hypothetical protein
MKNINDQWILRLQCGVEAVRQTVRASFRNRPVTSDIYRHALAEYTTPVSEQGFCSRSNYKHTYIDIYKGKPSAQ